MKKKTIIKKINKKIKELEKDKIRFTSSGRARVKISFRIMDLKVIKFDLEKLEC